MNSIFGQRWPKRSVVPDCLCGPVALQFMQPWLTPPYHRRPRHGLRMACEGHSTRGKEPDWADGGRPCKATVDRRWVEFPVASWALQVCQIIFAILACSRQQGKKA